jgi:peptide chain release factor 2
MTSRPCSTGSTTFWCDFDVVGLEREAERLEAQSLQPGFWDDQREAQTTMRRLADVRRTAETWRGIEKRARDLLELIEISLDEEDEALAADLQSETQTLATEVGDLEFDLTFSGPYDDRTAILAVHAGEGGTESQDWAEKLLRMYTRWAERHGYPWEIFDVTPGEEAGIKSATVEISGAHVYGYLKGEAGVHRLVRISPFDSSARRHTSFAKVEVLPEADEAGEIEIDEDDLRVDVFRASGHGGQNVQKNSTAIRITHLPTGIVVTCQNERSQHRNRESAMKVLYGKLLEIDLQRRADEQAKLKGENISAGFGNAVRSYVLHPYKLVKDQRSAFESSDPNAILDGDLDEMLKEYLKATMGGNGQQSSR